MAYPPTVSPAGRADNTPLPINHPDDHNKISGALTDIINELGAGPKGPTAPSVEARLDRLGPVGEIVMYAGAVAPTSFRLCDGAAISRLSFAALYAIIGTTYGAGDGAETFNVPDLRSRAPIGAGQSPGLAVRALGVKLGEEAHVLTSAEAPIHSHGGETGWGKAMSYRLINDGSGGTGRANNHATAYTGAAGWADYTDDQYPMSAHRHVIPPSGGGGAHNNMQPSVALNFIIRLTA